MRTPVRASLVALALMPSLARASGAPGDDDKTLPCRPTIACTADLARPGTSEIEAGYLVRRLDDARQVSSPFLAKLTLAPWIQAQIGGNGYVRTRGGATADYFDNLAPGLKIHLRDQSDRAPSISVSAAASLPTWTGQTGYVRSYGASSVAYVTKDFGPLHADLNAGLAALRLEGRPIVQPFTALALSGSLPAPFGIFGELYVFGDAVPAAAHDAGALFGLTHSPKPWLVFDVGADLGLFPATRAFSAFVGMSIVPFVLEAR